VSKRLTLNKENGKRAKEKHPLCCDIESQHRQLKKAAEKRPAHPPSRSRRVEGRDYASLVFYFVKGSICKNTGNQEIPPHKEP